MSSDNLCLVEWSFKQRCFHIGSVADALDINVRAFRAMRRMDFIPLGIYSSHAKAHAACEQFSKWRARRGKGGGKRGAE